LSDRGLPDAHETDEGDVVIRARRLHGAE
jgi:hypothetical protein